MDKHDPRAPLLSQKFGQAQINFPPTYKFDKYSVHGSVCHFCRVCEMLPVALGVVSKSILSSKSCKSSSSMKQHLVRKPIPLWGFLTKLQTCNQCKMLQFATLVPLKPKWFSLGFPQSSPGCFALLACGRKFMIPPRSKGFPVGRSLCPVMGVDKSLGGHFFWGTSFSYSFFFIPEKWWSSQKSSWSCCFVLRFPSHVFFLWPWNVAKFRDKKWGQWRQQNRHCWLVLGTPSKTRGNHSEIIIPHPISSIWVELTW